MMVLTAITAIMAIYAVYLVMRHNMHMFQLNGYKNGEHLNRLKKNIRQQWLLIFTFMTGLIRLFVPFTALDVLGYLTLLLVILVYNAMKRLNTKKKLVYTARVKRLITTANDFSFDAIEIVLPRRDSQHAGQPAPRDLL